MGVVYIVLPKMAKPASSNRGKGTRCEASQEESKGVDYLRREFITTAMTKNKRPKREELSQAENKVGKHMENLRNRNSNHVHRLLIVMNNILPQFQR